MEGTSIEEEFLHQGDNAILTHCLNTMISNLSVLDLVLIFTTQGADGQVNIVVHLDLYTNYCNNNMFIQSK